MHPLAQLDLKHIWHPFTQMRDWLRGEPIVLVEGQGAILRDIRGKEYLDANSSIWTNLHGHNHPALNRALTRQLRKVAHTSALGFANEPASLLSERLVNAANPGGLTKLPQSSKLWEFECDSRGKLSKPPKPQTEFGVSHQNPQTGSPLEKVFFSDNGSTATEVALKLAYEFTRRSGLSKTPKFLSLGGAYHGDTVGAVSLGHIDLFHKAYSGLLFKSASVPAPYCYRCPHNRAKPDRIDARECRKCSFECLAVLEKQLVKKKKTGEPYAGFVFEPLIQGAAGMIPQPQGWLSQATTLARNHGALLIADEVMTGFGRTGTHKSLFACHKEGVQPDLMALAKGLTGGYLPMAATLTTQLIFNAFLGEYEQFKTFFHGHSYTGNQLGAATALASLNLLGTKASFGARQKLETSLAKQLSSLWCLNKVGDIRQVGLVAGIELVKHWKTRKPFLLKERAGIRVCEEMAKRGVLTRPIGNVIVIMPPYCTTAAQVQNMIEVTRESIRKVLGGGPA